MQIAVRTLFNCWLSLILSCKNINIFKSRYIKLQCLRLIKTSKAKLVWHWLIIRNNKKLCSLFLDYLCYINICMDVCLYLLNIMQLYCLLFFISQVGHTAQVYITKNDVALVRARADVGSTDDMYAHGSAFVITECMQVRNYLTR